MPVPTYDRFIEPILRFLAEHPEGATARDVPEAAAAALGLSDADKQELLPNNILPVYKNRASWALLRLKRVGVSTSPRRGFWKLTEEGLAFVAQHPEPLSREVLAELATRNNDVRLRQTGSGEDIDSLSRLDTSSALSTASPDDRLEEALAEIRQTVAAEVLEALRQVSPAFFETIVLDLLHRMRYGASRTVLQRAGGPRDGGIDGIISLDKLGLEKVYVQAKWWQQTVGRPDVQAFYGALAGQKAKKGVFITTSAFTPQAIEFARSVEGVVLVDGTRLAEMMIDHEVGVTLRSVSIPKLDSDYFEEGSV